MRKVTIIAEVGSNWLGKIQIGKRLIKECKDRGADCVKFQVWKAKELYNDSHPYWKQINESELTFSKASELKSYADRIGIEWFASVFYPDGVAWLESLGVKMFKISNRRSPRDVEVMKRIAETGLPQICSISSLEDAHNCIEILGNPPFEMLKLLYCVPEYPCPDERVNLSEIDNLRKELRYEIGFSDHTLGITASIAAAAVGAAVIEKHVMLKKNTVSADACCSITVDELEQLVMHVRRIENMRYLRDDKREKGSPESSGT